MWGDLVPVGAVRWLDAGRYSFLLTALLSTENGPIVPANHASDYILLFSLMVYEARSLQVLHSAC